MLSLEGGRKMCKHWIKSCEVEIAASEIRDPNLSVSDNICFIYFLLKNTRKEKRRM